MIKCLVIGFFFAGLNRGLNDWSRTPVQRTSAPPLLGIQVHVKTALNAVDTPEVLTPESDGVQYVPAAKVRPRRTSVAFST